MKLGKPIPRPVVNRIVEPLLQQGRASLWEVLSMAMVSRNKKKKVHNDSNNKNTLSIMATSCLFDPNKLMVSEMYNQTSLKELEEADKPCDAFVEAGFDSNRGDGAGWYLDHMEKTTPKVGESHYTIPAAFSAPLPLQHPMRVIVKILDDVPNGECLLHTYVHGCDRPPCTSRKAQDSQCYH